MLASKGHRVILVDADPQCNLTGMALGFSGTDLDEFYERQPGRNFYSALLPAFESRPVLLQPVDCLAISGQENLFLLPGNIRLSEYEVSLGIAQELTGSLQTLQNLPGAMSYVLEKTSQYHNADFVLVDMSPSLTSINQNLLMTSDFFIIPASPDYFSVMAIDSLSQFLPRWSRWQKRAQELPLLREASYPYPQVSPKLLGTVVQKYRTRSGGPTRPFQRWVDRFNDRVKDQLLPALRNEGMLLPDDVYRDAGVPEERCLALVSEFNSLIARSQENNKPVYALTDEELEQRGMVLRTAREQRDQFLAVFSQLADKIVALTSAARAVGA